MRIGIDLGGTKIEGVALDAAGACVAQQRVATPQGDYAATVVAIRDLVHQLEQQTGQTGSVGVGIPGAISPITRLVKNANSTCLIGHPLDRDLSEALDRPVRLANDANCFVLSEATDGAAAGVELAFGVILGTGVGGGIAHHAAPHLGQNAIAGEWGHNPLPWATDDDRPAAACYCGQSGCIETYLNGAGLSRAYASENGVSDTVTAIQIAARAEDQEPAAISALNLYVSRLARALASVINLLDPEIIVLGGGLSNIEALYREVPKIWNQWVFSDETNTRLVKNVHGDSSGVRGAAWLWPNDDVV